MSFEQHERAVSGALQRWKNINYLNLISDMTPGEIRLLAAICQCDEGSLKVSDLYEACNMHPTAVSRLMNSLEKRALIIRSTRTDNRRITDVAPTEQGRLISARNRAILRDFWQEVLDGIPEEDIETMLRIQKEIMESMEKVLEARACSGKEASR